MAPKPKRSWTDVQMAIMTISLAAALGLWNLFAGPVQRRQSRQEQPAAPRPGAVPKVPRRQRDRCAAVEGDRPALSKRTWTWSL